MPTRAGQRCSRRPGRLHRTSSLRHDSSVDSSISVNLSIGNSNNINNMTDEQERGESRHTTPRPEPDVPEVARSVHDGSTPVIEETPGADEDGERSTSRSTPCPGGGGGGIMSRRAPALGLGNLEHSPSDMEMPDAPPLSTIEAVNFWENDRAIARALSSANRRHESLRGPTAGLVGRQALRDAGRETCRAGREGVVTGGEAEEAGSAVNGETRTKTPATMAGFDDQIVARGRAEAVCVNTLVLLVTLILFYALFCWLHWPEISYTRSRRRAALGV